MNYISLKYFMVFFCFVVRIRAVYFFINTPGPKCFFEQLPKDVMVVGRYRVERYNEKSQRYEVDPRLGIFISVDEVFDDNHRIISQNGASEGRFTFSPADPGEHRLCFLPTPSGETWWNLDNPNDRGLKFDLSMVTGDTYELENSEKIKLDDISHRVSELNSRLSVVRREQLFQREREAEFRNLSEKTNSKVIKWTLTQLVILTITCIWQLSHLRTFFIKQKLT